MSLPFSPAEDVDALHLPGDDRRRDLISLVNPLSQEEAVLRTSLLGGLLRAARRNVNRQVADVALFETGRVFLRPTEGEPGAVGGPAGVTLPAEPQMLGLVACGSFESARHDRPARAVDVYDLLGAIEVVRRSLGVSALEVRPADDMPYHPGRAARLLLDGEELGVVGELHPRVIAAFDVPPRTLAGELRLAPLVRNGVLPAVSAQPSPLPGARFDVAVIVEESTPAAAVEAAVRQGAGELVTSCRLFDVYTGEQVGEGHKSLAFTLQLDSAERQLTDDDVTAAIEGIEQAVAEQVAGRLRR